MVWYLFNSWNGKQRKNSSHSRVWVFQSVNVLKPCRYENQYLIMTYLEMKVHSGLILLCNRAQFSSNDYQPLIHFVSFTTWDVQIAGIITLLCFLEGSLSLDLLTLQQLCFSLETSELSLLYPTRKRWSLMLI